MKYNELVIGKQKKSQRVGRGISAGGGKTAGRGTKGQGSRKSPVKSGFEGGQMPLYMRLPKLRGFKSHKPSIENVHTSQLDKISKATIDNAALHATGLISSPHVSVKLLFDGPITNKKEIKLQSASKNAVAAIEKAGGNFRKTAQIARETTKKPKA